VVRHRKSLQWAFVGLALLVLVVWSEPTTLVAVIVVAISLVLIGLVGFYGGDRRSLSPTDRPAAVGPDVDGSSSSAKN
jgi:hypothetical protein